MIELGIIPIGVCQAYYLGLQDKKIKIATQMMSFSKKKHSLKVFCVRILQFPDSLPFWWLCP